MWRDSWSGTIGGNHELRTECVISSLYTSQSLNLACKICENKAAPNKWSLCCGLGEWTACIGCDLNRQISQPSNPTYNLQEFVWQSHESCFQGISNRNSIGDASGSFRQPPPRCPVVPWRIFTRNSPRLDAQRESMGSKDLLGSKWMWTLDVKFLPVPFGGFLKFKIVVPPNNPFQWDFPL